MALISPGIQVTVTDESQYQPTAQGTIPLILLATEQDKTNPSGTLATGTALVNAEKLQTITSQRELISLFGRPTFKLDASGNPIHASELNEYGLLTAYSALNVSNRAYVIRANVDLGQLEGTSIRPTGAPTDGVYWLDLTATRTGLFEFDASTGTFISAPVTAITSSTYLSGAAPISSFGAIGEYAINVTTPTNPIYYKRYDNTWTLVGSGAWQLSQPVITGAVSNPSNLAVGSKMIINETVVTLTSPATVTSAVADINALNIPGVKASVSAAGQIEIRGNASATSTGNLSVLDGVVKIKAGSSLGGANVDCAVKLGLYTTADITANLQNTGKELNTPTVAFDTYRNVPAWLATDAEPRPGGSVWFKTTETGNGANWAIKQFNATTEAFENITAPLYESDEAALFGLDPTGGGTQISLETVYVRYDVSEDGTAKFTPYVKEVAGALTITGTSASVVFDDTDSFTIEISVPGSSLTESATIELSGTSKQSLVADILAANLQNFVAGINSSGSVFLTHLAGGTIRLRHIGSSTVISDAGWTTDSRVTVIDAGTEWLASPFAPLTYTYSTSAPYADPTDGTLWYYNNPLEVDILINDGTNWKGYRNVSNDARGFDLTLTDPAGPILSATQPTTQSDGETALTAGDLWIDTSNLEAYPVIYRYDGFTWNLIDNADQITSDGVVFADARWDLTGTTDPISDAIPDIASLAESDYLDDDCPSYALYPRGALLFNTRRSGYNVKRFESQWHQNASPVPTVVSAWVSHSGVDTATGVPYFGSKAQRNTVVEAMKSAVESSVDIREERIEFNLICAPGYPELIQNMITLNNDRKQTAFIIGDSPLTLKSGSTNITNWATNAGLAVDNGTTGLVSRSEYLGVYYPSCFATNLDGNSVVVPASHAMLRTIIRSDNQNFPWFAPAGVRRGVLDNVTAIGYVDVDDGYTFKSIGVTAGLRDTLYENNINPLTVLPGVGLVAYGQKTRATQTSAMDRINVARLVAYLRSVLDKVARPFVFEPNDTVTRNQVKNAFEAVLNDLVAKRGLYDYLVVCDETNNTPDRIDRNELYVDIAIEPVKAIEFIYIPVRIKGTGDIAKGL